MKFKYVTKQKIWTIFAEMDSFSDYLDDNDSPVYDYVPHHEDLYTD